MIQPICFILLLSAATLLQAVEQVPLTVTEDAGVARKNEMVTSGVPFPQGALATNAHVRLLDAQGQEIPTQIQTTATWRDGSVKWLLLDFPANVPSHGAAKFVLEYGKGVSRQAKGPPLQLSEDEEAVWINTGPLRFSIAKKHFGLFDEVYLDRDGDGSFESDERMTSKGLRQSLSLAKEFAAWKPKVLPPDEVILEEAGPNRAVVKISGWIDDGTTNRLVQYLLRVHAHAGSPSVKVFHTTVQMSPKIKMLWVKDFSLSFEPKVEPTAKYLFGGQPLAHRGSLESKQSASLVQLREGGYTFTSGAGKTESGFKSPGWIDVADARGGVLMGNRYFWQQFPKALTVSAESGMPGASRIRIGLYPEEEAHAFDMDQGLAKTYELQFDFHAGQLTPEQCAQKVTGTEHPLFAVAPTAWYCDSKVFGDLLPFDFDLFPDYETLTEASGDQFIKKMATGLRHWGDVYYGGEYKGTNSYMNLEYDVHHNFYCQFARTGLRKYLDTAIIMAKHQADIDTNHKTGWQWKHSPRHVEIQAEFGHTFTRGLLETYFLTGNRRCLEVAIELGDYFIKQIRNPRELGNERQIGWSLISLLPVYEATWDERYFEAARQTVERLLAGLDARGKFNIRWDNRISFFNGIAATGFIYYYRATGDERVADAALRVIRRAQGFYPEYAGRTLEAIAWAYERTQEPEYLDLLKVTWEATLARVLGWNTMELGAPTIFTVHALPFMARSGFIPKPARALDLTPAQFDTANGMHAHHLPAGEAELYIQSDSAEPFDLVIIRKGAWKASGTATLFDPTGHPIATLDYPKEGVIWQRQVIPVQPKRKGAYRLAMRSPNIPTMKGGSLITWDVVTSRPMPAVFASPGHKGLELVTPYLFTMPTGDSDKIELELVGEGEGFKKAVIFDPDGKVAGSMEAFIDLGDKGRYHYKVSADIPPHQLNALWKISLQEVSVAKITGLAPYFSTSQKSFFRPDKAP